MMEHTLYPGNDRGPLRLLGVVRVSNEDLAHGYGPQIQEAELTVDAPANHYVLLDTRELVEQATIDLEERELFQQVLAEAIHFKEVGKGDGLAFSRVDRLSRKFEAALEIALDCRKHGLTLRFVRENSWLRPDDEPVQFVMFVLHALSADTGTKITFKNTKEGQYRAARAGRLPGGLGPGLNGYNLVGPGGDKRFEINTKMPMVQAVLELGIKGASMNKIVRDLQTRGIKITRRMVQNVLGHSRVYAGEYKWAGITIPDLVPPVITLAEAEIIESYRHRNKRQSLGFGRRNWLSGRVRCDSCGRVYLLAPSKNRATCSGRDPLRVPTPCPAPVLKFSDVDYAVWHIFLRNLVDSEMWGEKLKQSEVEYQQQKDKLKAEVANAEAQVKKFQGIMDRLLWQHAEGLLTNEQLRERAAQILPNTRLFDERLETLRRAIAGPHLPPSLEELESLLTQIKGLVDSASDTAKAELAERFNLQVTILPGELPGFALKIFASIPLGCPESQVFSHPLLHMTEPIVYQSSR